MDKKPEQPGAPTPIEIKPQPSNEDRPSFSFRELELAEVSYIDGYKFLFFMVRGEFVVCMKEFEYYNLLSFIFDEIQFIQVETDGQGCTCDIITPNYNIVQDDFKISVHKIDVKSDQVSEEEKYIKVFEVYDLLQNTIVGFHQENEHRK